MIRLADYLDKDTRVKLKLICDLFDASEFRIIEGKKEVLFVKLPKKEEKPCGS